MNDDDMQIYNDPNAEKWELREMIRRMDDEATELCERLHETSCRSIDSAFQVSEIRGRIESDLMTLALRLYGEDPDTFAPETREVMDRMRPKIEAMLRGEVIAKEL